jgi:hypothetical protein
MRQRTLLNDTNASVAHAQTGEKQRHNAEPESTRNCRDSKRDQAVAERTHRLSSCTSCCSNVSPRVQPKPCAKQIMQASVSNGFGCETEREFRRATYKTPREETAMHQGALHAGVAQDTPTAALAGTAATQQHGREQPTIRTNLRRELDGACSSGRACTLLHHHEQLLLRSTQGRAHRG